MMSDVDYMHDSGTELLQTELSIVLLMYNVTLKNTVTFMLHSLFRKRITPTTSGHNSHVT